MTTTDHELLNHRVEWHEKHDEATHCPYWKCVNTGIETWSRPASLDIMVDDTKTVSQLVEVIEKCGLLADKTADMAELIAKAHNAKEHLLWAEHAAASKGDHPQDLGMWRQQIDPKSGCPYYEHAETGETTWQLPSFQCAHQEQHHATNQDGTEESTWHQEQHHAADQDGTEECTWYQEQHHAADEDGTEESTWHQEQHHAADEGGIEECTWHQEQHHAADQDGTEESTWHQEQHHAADHSWYGERHHVGDHHDTSFSGQQQYEHQENSDRTWPNPQERAGHACLHPDQSHVANQCAVEPPEIAVEPPCVDDVAPEQKWNDGPGHSDFEYSDEMVRGKAESGTSDDNKNPTKLPSIVGFRQNEGDAMQLPQSPTGSEGHRECLRFPPVIGA